MAEDGAAAPAQSPADEPGAADQLMARLPAELFDSLTPGQRAALWSAAHSPTWRRYPINIRVSLPFVGGRWFLTVVGGAERRNEARWRRERKLHPLPTPGNFAFLLGLGLMFYGAAVLIAVLVGLAGWPTG